MFCCLQENIPVVWWEGKVKVLNLAILSLQASSLLLLLTILVSSSSRNSLQTVFFFHPSTFLPITPVFCQIQISLCRPAMFSYPSCSTLPCPACGAHSPLHTPCPEVLSLTWTLQLQLLVSFLVFSFLGAQVKPRSCSALCSFHLECVGRRQFLGN